MAKDIQWMGAIFPDVPSITLPQQGGGLVSFDDTSDGDIQPADVTQGKIGYAQGQRVVGTATPSTPTIEALSVTENGTYTAPSGVDGYSPITVNVPGIVPTGSQTFIENGTYDVTSIAEAVINVAGGGGGGLEYETGVWTPSADVNRGEISFTKSHSIPPAYITLQDGNVNTQPTNYSVIIWNYVDYYRFFGTGYVPQYTSIIGSFVQWLYRTSGAGNNYSVGINKNSDNAGNSDKTYARYWADKDKFYPYCNSTSYFFRSNRTYKWIAIWAPTT